MADITMCGNWACSRRNRCYRSMAVVGDRQSWVIFNENTEDYENCSHYIEYVRYGRKVKRIPGKQ